MRLKFVKKIAKTSLVICLLLTLSITSFASVVAYGSEDAGYMVATSQLRKNTNTYDDSALNSTYKGYMKYGVKVWKESGVITLKRKKSSDNKIDTYSSKNTSTVAYTNTWVNTATGKIQRFEIKFNKAIMNGRDSTINKTTAAHEVGHTIGLLDLYEKKNKNKLMYGITNRTARKPTKADIKGGKYATRK